MLTNRAFLSGLRHRHHARSYGGKFYACRCQAVPQRKFQTSRGKGVCAQVHHQECHFRGCHPSCNDKAGSHSEAGCSQQAAMAKQAAAKRVTTNAQRRLPRPQSRPA